MSNRTALYGRTSQDDRRKVTIEIQQRALREWAAHDPIVGTVVAEYWDEGVSGKVPLWERPEGRKLVEAVKAGQVNSIAVVYADRFGRTLLDALQAAKLLEGYGAKLVAVNDGWDARRNDSPLNFQLRIMLAEEEHRRICERMEAGKRRAAKRDDAPPGGPLVFGYRSDRQGRFVVDPVESAIVRQVFELAASGKSFSQILAWIKTLQIPAGRRTQRRGYADVVISPSRRGADSDMPKWRICRIGRMLRSRVYIGERRWRDMVFQCPAIVDRELFEKVQLVLADHDRIYSHRRGDPEKGWMSGLIVCGLCGRRFYSSTYRGGNGGRYRRYVCAGRRDRAVRCKAICISVRRLDGAVWQHLEEVFRNPGYLLEKIQKGAGRRRGSVEMLESDSESILAAIHRIDAEVGQIWQMQKANNFPFTWVAEKLQELQASRVAYQKRLETLNARMANVELEEERAGQLASLVVKWKAGLLAATPAQKQEVARLAIASAVLHTQGEGVNKTAELELETRWGESLVREVPKQQCLA